MAYPIIKIDPWRKTVAKLALAEHQKDFTRTMRRLTKASVLGHQKICDVEGTPMYVAASAQALDGIPAFRFRGVEGTTAGIGVLFGTGPKGGLIGCPADVEWVKRHITWLTGEEADAE